MLLSTCPLNFLFIMKEYSPEELEAIYAEVISQKAQEKLDEERLAKQYAMINSALEDEDVHPVFGKCIASFTIEEYAHINGTYGAGFFTDPESIKFHQKTRGQEFLRKR